MCVVVAGFNIVLVGVFPFISHPPMMVMMMVMVMVMVMVMMMVMMMVMVVVVMMMVVVVVIAVVIPIDVCKSIMHPQSIYTYSLGSRYSVCI